MHRESISTWDFIKGNLKYIFILAGTLTKKNPLDMCLWLTDERWWNEWLVNKFQLFILAVSLYTEQCNHMAGCKPSLKITTKQTAIKAECRRHTVSHFTTVHWLSMQARWRLLVCLCSFCHCQAQIAIVSIWQHYGIRVTFFKEQDKFCLIINSCFITLAKLVKLP